MDIWGLKIFKTVAEEGSISNAASKLNCVQSNVTARVRQLEHELGVSLFYRKHRGVELTRPPSEWDSLLIKVTNGCTHRCTFCSMYRTKKFSVRKDIEEIKNDIRKAGEMFGNRVEKIFLEDGNAFELTGPGFSCWALPGMTRKRAGATRLSRQN